MKRILSSILVLVMVVSLSFVCLAASVSDWQVVGAGDATIAVDGTAIKMTQTGGYPTNNNGVKFDGALNMVNGITFEYQIDAFPAAGNCWFGPSVLDKDFYFDVTSTDKGEGFAFLIWPSGVVQIMGISKTAAAGFDTVYQFMFPSELKGVKVKMELKQDATSGIAVKINDVLMTPDREVNAAYLNLFSGNDAHFSFSSSDLGEGTQTWRVFTINGAVAAAAAGTTTTPGTNPQTGDAGSTAMLLVGAVSALGALVLLRRK